VAAVVVVDDLGEVGEGREQGLEPRVVETRAAVHQDQGRLLAHRRSVGNEPGAFDVDEKPDAGFDRNFQFGYLAAADINPG